MNLAGRGVLVTRPPEQAAGLAALVEAAGGRPLLFPSLLIEPLAPPVALRRLERFHLAIFVSPIAVEQAMRHVARWPAGVQCAAVGTGTRRALEARGVGGIIAPAGAADSEALLALPALQDVHGRRVLIVRGEGGRALLGETLRARGAEVELAECYRRVRPKADPAPVIAAWEAGALHAVTVSSSAGLENLFAMLGVAGERWLRATPLFAPHVRVAAHAERLGAGRVVVAGPGDAEMIDRLVAYFST